MRHFRVDPGLQRQTVGGFELPLGIEAEGLPTPREGYLVGFREGEEEDPDTYVFEATVSHPRLRALVRDALDLLPGEVRGILEVESLDAYRTIDVHLGIEPIDRDDLLADYAEFEEIVLEDPSIGLGDPAGCRNHQPHCQISGAIYQYTRCMTDGDAGSSSRCQINVVNTHRDG